VIRNSIKNGVIGSLYRKIKKNVNLDRTYNKKIRDSRKLLKNYSFNEIALLGIGKDGVTYKGSFNGEEGVFVVKVLSSYAKSFLAVSEDVQSKAGSLDAFYDVEIRNSEIMKYSYEPLSKIQNYTAREFASIFLSVCRLEKDLLSNGLVIWDFGFSAPNYMLGSEENVKWIDYGGNSFLYIDPSDAPIAPLRPNLVHAKNDFLVLSIILHWCKMVLENQESGALMTSLQDAKITFEEAFELVEDIIEGSAIEFLKNLRRIDLLNANGWTQFEDMLNQFVEGDAPEVLEAADIESVSFEDGGVDVIGYQNYTIRRQKLEPKDMGHKWAPSYKKWEIVDGIIKELQVKGSYLDIGSNLGMYVFSASINHGLEAFGVDYNKEYVRVCSKIAKSLELNCSFRVSSFSDIDLNVECVSALGIIHHLYHRTEGYNTLIPIFKKFSEITNQHLIVEFPNEHDSKAAKWTNMSTKKVLERYSEENFINASSRYFSLVRKYDGVIPERPIYLFRKL
jgi:hypothetical protein